MEGKESVRSVVRCGIRSEEKVHRKLWDVRGQTPTTSQAMKEVELTVFDNLLEMSEKGPSDL